jgi:catecholate siderophore receptor
MTRRGGLRASLIATTLCVVTAAPASADAPIPTEDKVEKVTVTGKRSSYRQSTSSTATKTDTSLQDVPQSVTVISKDLIKDQDMRSMMDVVRYVPGVSMGQGEGHRDAPTLRGNSSTADFFVDGVRDDVQYYRDLYNAERIEILKGPNAMIFGRGGGGGVINRVTERADWTDRREVTVQGGSYDSWRGAVDFGGGLSESAAVRLNAFYENSDSYRDYVNVERFGINPTATITLSPETEFRIGYEYFDDHRTVDRGVPSRNGRPLEIRESAFFGNPDQSYADTAVHFVHATLEHEFTPELTLRNHTVYADYDKFYQNVHANSAVNGAGNVSLQAYDSTTLRQNAFNQTDLIWDATTGPIKHRILAGVEFGWQDTDNTRAPNNNTAGTVNIANPTTFVPAVFLGPLQTDNFVEVALAAVYLQDQIELSEQFQIVAGVRFDSFDLDFDDRRAANADFSRTDELISPRVGAIYKPIEPVSLYASYAVSYLPQSGDQFGSLDATTTSLDPEEFENIEVGLKWDVLPSLTLTAALYQLDRTNTRAIDPITSLTVLTGEQRSEGFELGLAGAVTDAWSVMAGYAIQNSEITKTTTAAPAGREVPLVPEQTFALWNHYQFTKDFGAGLGVTHQTDMFASISNAVVLPAFTRVDAGVYYTVNETFDLQVNVENLFDETYWSTAHNDNNITPGSPRAVRVTLTSRF